ncbi:hypothetical protein [Aquipseudomonas alcaligenes]|uniref:hypothetical protein n=1 Tax=Aquipseudomonas alcaligenes TaxID=43263 RepID=UPI0012E8C8B3|nr:hypothetical protein [Pseudomonas alcaligenes]
MQINFYMADEDRRAFHEYLYSRGAYLVPERWPTRDIPIVQAASEEASECKDFKIFKSDLFPQSEFQNRAWITWHEPTKRFYVHGPGIQYLVSFTDANGIHRGRLYMGLVSPRSFVEPHGQSVDCYAENEKKYKALENFHKSCARYIRNHYRKDEGGFYHGKASDMAVQNYGVSKTQL